jgi:protein-S-isoprenylcysteine O-methyltransferase Ste14
MPQSVTSQWINGIGVAGLVLATLASAILGIPSVLAGLICILAYAIPIAVLELVVLKVHRRETTGLDWSAPQPLDWPRIGTKLIGLAGFLGATAAAHWLLRFYPIEQMALFGTVALIASFVLVPAIFAYFVLVDRVMLSPRDGYWHAGMAIRGRFDQVDMKLVRDLAMGWLVKGFFLPVMVVYLISSHGRLQVDVEMLVSGHILAVRWLTEMVAACELAIVVVGYTMTARAFDAHIRSTNPLVWGWLVTLACYEPFNHVVSGRILAYEDGLRWYDWFEGVPAISWIWAVLLLFSFVGWLWATAAYGLRWSNLTNRGIITNGPYRFTKHPDYLTKSIFFWLLSVPFLANSGPLDAARNCALLALVNVLYLLRARAEEKHLSADPAYVAYALAMNERGMFSALSRIIPALRYRQPVPSSSPA